MNRINKAVAAFATVALMSFAPAAAFAQASQPATTPGAKSSTPGPATPAPAPAESSSKPRSAVSVECSKEADAKGLHGKARREFRSECRKNAMGKPS